MSIRDWPESDRPREKLLKVGAAALSEAELLAILLGTGVRGRSALDLARDLLADFGSLRTFLTADRARVCKTRGRPASSCNSGCGTCRTRCSAELKYLLVGAIGNESLDRLSRDTVDVALRLFLDLTSKGVTIVTIMDGQVYSNTTIRDNWTKLIMALAVMARANEESVTKSRRVKESYERRRKNGEIAQGKFPAWLRKVDKKSFEPDPEKAALVNRIFDMALDGFGSRIIARQLDQEGVKTLQWAKDWNQALVSGLLRNHAVYGSKGDNENYYRPIMSKEKFMMTCERSERTDIIPVERSVLASFRVCAENVFAI